MRGLIPIVLMILLVVLDGVVGGMSPKTKQTDRWLLYSLLTAVVVLTVLFLYVLE